MSAASWFPRTRSPSPPACALPWTRCCAGPTTSAGEQSLSVRPQAGPRLRAARRRQSAPAAPRAFLALGPSGRGRPVWFGSATFDERWASATPPGRLRITSSRRRCRTQSHRERTAEGRPHAGVEWKDGSCRLEGATAAAIHGAPTAPCNRRVARRRARQRSKAWRLGRSCARRAGRRFARGCRSKVQRDSGKNSCIRKASSPALSPGRAERVTSRPGAGTPRRSLRTRDRE